MRKNTKLRTVALYLLALLIVITVVEAAFNEQQASALKPHQVIVLHPDYPSATYARFMFYSSPDYLWHYNYSKSENLNQRDFDKWYCSNNNSDFNLDGTINNNINNMPAICSKINKITSNNPSDRHGTSSRNMEPQDAVDLMRKFTVYGDNYSWFLVNNYHEDNYNPLPTDGIKQINAALQNTFAPIKENAWKVFLKYEQKAAFHYNYNKSYEQNLQDFTTYTTKTGVLKTRWMWYNERVRDEVLYGKALGYVTGHLPLGELSIPPNKLTPHDINGWLGFQGKQLDYLWRV